MEKRKKQIFFSLIVIFIIIFAIVFYQYFLPKEDKKKMITAYDYLDEAWERGLEWNSEAYLIGINSMELMGSAEVPMGLEWCYPDLSSDKTYGDGKTPVWMYGFGVDINPYTADPDLAYNFVFYYNGSVISDEPIYMGDEIPPTNPSIDSDEAARIARTDEGFNDALNNATDIRISYKYYPRFNEWWIEYESPDSQYEGKVRIDCEDKTIIP